VVCLALGTATIYLTHWVVQQVPWRNSMYFQGVGSISSSELQCPCVHVLSHLTLLTGLIPPEILANATGTPLPPAWSVSLEWQYYLVAPLIAAMVRSGSGVLLLGLVAYLGLRFGSHWMNPHLAFLPAQLPLFLIGIGSFHVYVLFASGTKGRADRWAVPVAALLAASMLLGGHGIALAVWGLAFGCIFVEGTGWFPRALCAVRGVLLNVCLQRLGRISYPIYLIHWPVIIVCLALLLRLKPGLTSQEAVVSLFLIAMPTIIFVAWSLHRLVELPLIKFGKQGKPPCPLPAPTPVSRLAPP
jgi:peptidoglycan/LPS O-acetylase OafA/YrhL